MSRPAKWTVGIVLTLVVLCLLAYWRAHAYAQAVIDRHAREVRTELSALAERVAERPPLSDWPSNRQASERLTDALPIYERALAAVQAIPESDLEILSDFLYEELDVRDKALVHAFFSKHQALIDALQDVRYADRISIDPVLLDGLEGSAAVIPAWQQLDQFLRGATLNAFVLGQFRAAAELIELRLCMGRDCARWGDLIPFFFGMAVVREAASDCRHLLAQGVLDAEELRKLGRVVDRIDGNRAPLSTHWSVTGLLIRSDIVHAMDAPGTDPLEVSGLAKPRHFYSTRLMMAEALDLIPPMIEELGALDELPLREAILESERIRDAADETGNAVVRVVPIVAPWVYDCQAWSRTSWHLMRVSIALAGYRAVHGAWPPTLDDLVPAWLSRIDDCPLAGIPLGYDSGKVWSGGGDGDDDGGDRTVEEYCGLDEDGDIVWDLNDSTLPDPFSE